ncbi:cadherin-7 isoform X2 [Fundulus heteroclitus]|uniref:cadherin-7 isoform X2 n=1 Tax=Fundulus heteroclitus TaxID=8078 RepID=UPI00165B2698|nr:cadherin-7 isoform X2 [Fundulus heteroclitus]
MKSLCLLSVLALLVLSLWAEPGSLMLNSVVLREPRTGRPGGQVLPPPRRRRRSWVWNQFFVLEEDPGDQPVYVGKLHSDMDKGDGQVTYYLSGEGAMSTFTIDALTGDIHAIRRLDREQQAYYTLTAQVRDRNTHLLLEPESQFIIKVQDINDNAPRFLNGPYSARVPERSPVGTSVVTVAATDADDPTYGNSARLVYTILQGLPYFSVDPKTGVVRTALPDMDREIRDRYQLVIQAKDMMGQRGGLSGTTVVTVTLTDVNDNPPRFPRTRIKAVDLDLGPNAEVVYRILDGDGLGTFRITTDPNTQEGLVTLLKNLNFENKSSYTLKIEASNRHVDTRFLLVGPFSDVTMVRLLVEDEDEPPVFSSSLSHMVVSEGAPVGTSVGSVSAHDPDGSNSPIRYAVDRKSDKEHFFDIDSSSGTIRISRCLDRELRVMHNITVLGTETLDPSQVGTAVVLISVTDVNDNAPRFASEYWTSVCENVKPGQIIQTLSAVDPDDPENGHHFLFFLTRESAVNQSFTLRDNRDNTASVLTLQSGLLRRDRSVHLLPVVIADGGSPSLSSTNTLTITVCHCGVHGNQLCGQEAPWRGGVGTATAAVLTCVLTFLGVAMVSAVVRSRRMEPQTTEYEQDIQENIVCYDDEGGGEEDTIAFDMSALRHLNHMNPPAGCGTTEPQTVTQKTRLLQEFIRKRLQEVEVDLTAPSLDSLETYAFEGSGSAAPSLSSFSSCSSSESEQNFSFLRAWGPSFRKLADLYGPRLGGGGADWTAGGGCVVSTTSKCEGKT